jgi:hypothetical protein
VERIAIRVFRVGFLLHRHTGSERRHLRAYALGYRERFDENVDLVGLALANGAAARSGTFVVNGSPTKAAAGDVPRGRAQSPFRR